MSIKHLQRGVRGAAGSLANSNSRKQPFRDQYVLKCTFLFLFQLKHIDVEARCICPGSGTTGHHQEQRQQPIFKGSLQETASAFTKENVILLSLMECGTNTFLKK